MYTAASAVIVRKRVVAAAALLLTTATVLMLATPACGGGSENTSGTRTAGAADGITDSTGSGDLDPLDERVHIDEDIVVTGSFWTNSDEPVVFLLLTEEQTEGLPIGGQVVTLGSAQPDSDGAVSFRFRIADSYQTQDGHEVQVHSGQDWYVGAIQAAEFVDGSTGSHGTSTGPLRIE